MQTPPHKTTHCHTQIKRVFLFLVEIFFFYKENNKNENRKKKSDFEQKKVKMLFCFVFFQMAVLPRPVRYLRWSNGEYPFKFSQAGIPNCFSLHNSRDFGNGAAALGERPLWATLQWVGGIVHTLLPPHHPAQLLLWLDASLYYTQAHLLFSPPTFIFYNFFF